MGLQNMISRNKYLEEGPLVDELRFGHGLALKAPRNDNCTPFRVVSNWAFAFGFNHDTLSNNPLQVPNSIPPQTLTLSQTRICSVTLEKKREPFLGKTIFSGAATNKNGKRVPLNN